MIEFIQSIWAWIMQNKDNIITFFTSTTFVGIVTLVITIVKQMKKTDKNTASVNELTGSISNSNKIGNEVQETNDNVKTVSLDLKHCNEKIVQLEQFLVEFNNNLQGKINTMLDVQSIVYSTIKDDTIRNSVNSLLFQAKSNDASTKMQLQEELDSLKSKFANLANEISLAASTVTDESVPDEDATIKNSLIRG